MAGQPTDHIVRVDDERIGQAKASRTLPQVYGDRIARDEGCPKQSRGCDSILEVVDLRAVQAREEVKSNKGEGTLALLAILPNVGSSHEPGVVGEGHGGIAVHSARAVSRGKPDGSFEVADG